MNSVEIKDFEKLMESLEKAGWHPMVCDTPIPFFDNEVPCGVPNSVGDVVKEEEMIPRRMLTSLDDYAVRAKGDSMIGAGIQDGSANFDPEEYEEKINKLKECYKECSKKLSNHLFYIPIKSGDNWQIYRYANGEENIMTKQQFKSSF